METIAVALLAGPHMAVPSSMATISAHLHPLLVTPLMGRTIYAMMRSELRNSCRGLKEDAFLPGSHSLIMSKWFFYQKKSCCFPLSASSFFPPTHPGIQAHIIRSQGAQLQTPGSTAHSIPPTRASKEGPTGKTVWHFTLDKLFLHWQRRLDSKQKVTLKTEKLVPLLPGKLQYWWSC